MNQSYAYLLRFYIRITDYTVLNLLFFIAVYLRFKENWLEIFSSNNYVALLLFINLAWILTSSSIRYYRPARLNIKWQKRLVLFAQLLLFHVLLILAFNGIIKTYFSRLVFIYFYALLVFLIPLSEYLVRKLLRWQQQQLGIRNRFVFIGDESGTKDLAYYFDNPLNISTDREVIHLSDIPNNLIEHILKLHEEKPINELYVSVVTISEQQIQELASICEQKLIRIRLIVDYPKLASKPLEIINYDSIPVINIPITPLDEPNNKMLKRFFDIAFSLVVFVLLLWWLFPILAFLIKITSKGPVIFKQLRTGADNKEFECYKFRTMQQNDAANEKQAVRNDPRITPIGSFLRKTSLDEFPQFVNVLKGEMSVVGPRPHMLKHTQDYAKIVGNFMQRHAIKPGVTGLAQVKGYRGEITNYERLANRVKYDRFYVENWSLMLDLKIIIRTVLAIFKPHL